MKTFLLVCLVNVLIGYLSLGTTAKKIKGINQPQEYAENNKCTEFKTTLDSQLILHVPCVFIRLMERLKICELDTFKNPFLNLTPIKQRTDLVKKASRFKHRLGKTEQHDLNELEKTSNKLISYLHVTPANLTTNFDPTAFDCNLFGHALRTYLEYSQETSSLRSVFRAAYNSNNIHESVNFEPELIEKKIEQLKCTHVLVSDQSYYYYLKYVIMSLQDMVKFNGKLSIDDFAALFVPYFEMVNKFDRILPSHSILLHLLRTSDKMFASDSCKTDHDGKTKKSKLKDRN